MAYREETCKINYIIAGKREVYQCCLSHCLQVVNDITTFYLQTYNNYKTTKDVRLKETLRMIQTGVRSHLTQDEPGALIKGNLACTLLIALGQKSKMKHQKGCRTKKE